MIGKPCLQRTHQGTRGILHQVRDAVIGHGLAPVPQHRRQFT